jgi:aminocarboxymuconate-semialdehyde decarboxylase
MARLVDVHTHYLPAALVSALEKRQELPKISEGPDGRLIHYGEGNIHPVLPEMGDVERRLADMDDQGIDVAVLSINIPGIDWFPVADGPAIAREVNDELAALVAAHPDRLQALAALPMQKPEAAATELERCVDIGFRGGLIFSNVAGTPVDVPQFASVFEAAAHCDVPLLLHPTYPLTAKTVDAYALIPTLGFVFDTTTAAVKLVLGGLFDRHPNLKLILAHAGSLIPQLVGRIDYEAERDPKGMGAIRVPPSEHLRRLYTDTVCLWRPALESALAFFGTDHVMFGSDYPFWAPERTVATLVQTSIDAIGRESIRGRNALRCFRLETVS